jgi:hypothetical protein
VDSVDWTGRRETSPGTQVPSGLAFSIVHSRTSPRDQLGSFLSRVPHRLPKPPPDSPLASDMTKLDSVKPFNTVWGLRRCRKPYNRAIRGPIHAGPATVRGPG